MNFLRRHILDLGDVKKEKELDKVRVWFWLQWKSMSLL